MAGKRPRAARKILAGIKVSGKSLRATSHAIGVTPGALSNYLAGRSSKAGAPAVARMRAYFIAQGWIQRRPKAPPACRVCGALYPTRKHPPKQILDTSPSTMHGLEGTAHDVIR